MRHLLPFLCTFSYHQLQPTKRRNPLDEPVIRALRARKGLRLHHSSLQRDIRPLPTISPDISSMEIANANPQKGRSLRGLLDRSAVGVHHASLQKSIRILMTFISGCVCGVVNAYYRVMLEKTDDGMRHMLPVLVTSIVEIDIGIIVGCMPAFKSFIQTHLSSKSLQIFSLRYLRSRLSTLRSPSSSNRSRILPASGDEESHKFDQVDSKNSERRGKGDVGLEVRSVNPV